MKDKQDKLLTPMILAGGMGTRLESYTKKIPKPLLKVNGRYFIEYILEKVLSAGFKEVYISISYLKETFMELIGEKYKDMQIKYLSEEEALGTGGAIKNVFKKIKANNLIIFNGDSFCEIDLTLFINNFRLKKRNTILLCKVSDSERFGNVIIDKDQKITSFTEKKKSTGYINAGIYILDNSIVKIRKKKFSIEKEYFERCNDFDIYGYFYQGKFIDIGTPKSFKRSHSFFLKIK